MLPSQWYYSKRLLITLSTAIILSVIWFGFIHRQYIISKFFILPSNKTKNVSTTAVISYTPKPYKPRQHPYMALLNIQHTNGSDNCGGTLIERKYILTAAHCVDGASSVWILLGTDNIEKEEKSTVYLESENFIVHENYNNLTYDHDIALIYLNDNLTINEHVNTVSLLRHISSRGRTYVVGWGLPNLGQGLNDKLLEAGPCHGDSGGPLLLDDIQVGIVSGGDKYCNTSVPTVYTNTSYYWQWIKDNTERNELDKSKRKPHKLCGNC
ncbi:chymotrypsin-like isoform X2 [Zophobas morio]|uniref:chymotrypsin-like isoform X2 n=1 Tax=Zophobas morio TaxID=2755281 RepID=UPI003082FCD0